MDFEEQRYGATKNHTRGPDSDWTWGNSLLLPFTRAREDDDLPHDSSSRGNHGPL